MISGDDRLGVRVNGSGTDGKRVLRCYFGVDIAGSGVPPYASGGVQIDLILRITQLDKAL